jgi:hypothetical protein
VSGERRWNTVSLAVALIGAASALALAWRWRDLVGLERGVSCIIAPAWRWHLLWWLLVISVLLLLGLAIDAFRQLNRRRRTRTTLPVLGAVALLAAAFLVNLFGFGATDASCGPPQQLIPLPAAATAPPGSAPHEL